MMRWIRGARVDFRTGMVVIVLAVAVWAALVYLNLTDVEPGEFLDGASGAPTAPANP